MPGTVRLRARLSAALSWTASLLDAGGVVVASGSGSGQDVDWSFDARALAPGAYRYAIGTPDGSVTPATGPLGTADVPLAIENLASDPETVSPNGDAMADLTTITYTLTVPGNVTVRLRDGNGAEVATVSPKTWRRAGEHAVRFDPQALPDGIYTIEVVAAATGGRQAAATQQLAVSRTLAGVAASRAVFSPNADGRADRIGFRFELAAPAQVRLRILRDGKWVATPFAGPLDPGLRTIDWDGSKRVGRLLDGQYEAVLEATDTIATSRLAIPFASDTRSPKVKILQRFPLKVWVSEPATVTLRLGTRSVERKAEAAGELGIPNAPKAGIVRAVAWDQAGNKSIPVSKR